MCTQVCVCMCSHKIPTCRIFGMSYRSSLCHLKIGCGVSASVLFAIFVWNRAFLGFRANLSVHSRMYPPPPMYCTSKWGECTRTARFLGHTQIKTMFDDFYAEESEEGKTCKTEGNRHFFSREYSTYRRPNLRKERRLNQRKENRCWCKWRNDGVGRYGKNEEDEL